MLNMGLFSKAAPVPEPEPEPTEDVMIQRRGPELFLDMLEWPTNAVFPAFILRDRPEGMRWYAGMVDIRCANGRAIYRLGPYDAEGDRFAGSLVYSEGPTI